MEGIGRWVRVVSRSSGVERTFLTAQLGLVQVCCGTDGIDSSVVTGGGSDGLRLVMCEVSLGRGSGRGGVWLVMLGADRCGSILN
jgi:hypothetical protein